MMNVIDVQRLEKRFQNEEALQDVSFSIKRGEIFVFLGPTESGKTTTIKILTAQLTRSGGSVFLLGEDAEEMKKTMNRARFGMLTDNSGLYLN